MFSSRLDTLSHLLEVSEALSADNLEVLLHCRIAPDMFPFSTQIAFGCNQPCNFALCLGQSANKPLRPELGILSLSI
ncbi:DUF1993 family protein [Leptolyngbya sp. FACHB-321]|uniref:DUF1993 family protein n=1 Tax=Leptolyngbya sp. FACHB-321 TaxID=2692807 RepID=UPI0032201B9C